MIKGIEANIRAGRARRHEPDELAVLEIVVAAPHSALRSAADQTARMLAAVTTAGVHILGHPRGRSVRIAARASRPSGRGYSRRLRRAASRSRSTATRPGRTSTSRSPARRSTADASSRWTATRTPQASWNTRKRQSRTRATRACRATGSSTPGRSSGSSSGQEQDVASAFEATMQVRPKPDTTCAETGYEERNSDRPVISR